MRCFIICELSDFVFVHRMKLHMPFGHVIKNCSLFENCQSNWMKNKVLHIKGMAVIILLVHIGIFSCFVHILWILKICLAFESKVISLVSNKNVADVIILVTDFRSHDTYASRAYATVIFSQLNWIISEIILVCCGCCCQNQKYLIGISYRVFVCVCLYRSNGLCKRCIDFMASLEHQVNGIGILIWQFFAKRHKEIQLPRTNKHFAIFFYSLWIC